MVSLFSFQGQDQNKNKIIIIFKADDSFYFQRQQQVPDSIAVIRECIFFLCCRNRSDALHECSLHRTTRMSIGVGKITYRNSGKKSKVEEESRRKKYI